MTPDIVRLRVEVHLARQQVLALSRIAWVDWSPNLQIDLRLAWGRMVEAEAALGAEMDSACPEQPRGGGR